MITFQEFKRKKEGGKYKDSYYLIIYGEYAKEELAKMDDDYLKQLDSHYDQIRREVYEERLNGNQVKLSEYIDLYCSLEHIDSNDLRMYIRYYIDEPVSKANDEHWEKLMQSGEFITKENIKGKRENPIEVDRKLAMLKYYQDLPFHLKTQKIVKKEQDLLKWYKEYQLEGADEFETQVIESLF